MSRISECVSLGHPDKIADYISSYILDEYLEKDPNVKYALEVMIKDNHVILGGEITSTHKFTKKEITKFVQQAVNTIGYTKEYQKKWGKDNTICGDDLVVTQYISQQSPEINQGLSGWGDQGIMFGMAVNNFNSSYMPLDYAISKTLCKGLFESGLGGLDIKTQVVLDRNNISKIIVAIPLLDGNTKPVENYVRETILGNYELIINGTGSYRQHSTIADCGVTGRKLAVDFYGGNCNVGGGSCWGKDASKADVTLNIYARYKCLEFLLKNTQFNYIKCGIGCCIGKKDIDITFWDETNKQQLSYSEHKSPKEIIELLHLNTPRYRYLCENGIFSLVDKNL